MTPTFSHSLTEGHTVHYYVLHKSHAYTNQPPNISKKCGLANSQDIESSFSVIRKVPTVGKCLKGYAPFRETSATVEKGLRKCLTH